MTVVLVAIALPLKWDEAPSAASTLAVTVKGNQLIDHTGKAIRLLGVNFSGAEYACAEGWGIFDGPNDDASIAAIAAWRTNAVRVPLNESCWLGINGVPSAFGGNNYRTAIAAYVQRLNSAGLYAVLDLHWNAPGTTLAKSQQQMADADHSPAFWSSVASYFKANPAVVFDLYNEPHVSSWECWRDGCTTSAGWQTAGMQSLLDAVRATGARQPVIVNGNNYATDLTHWLTYRPSDPAGQVVAGFHSYSDNYCNNLECWNNKLGRVAASVPIVTGELGQSDCAHAYVDSYMKWADSIGVSYLGWSWNPFGCTEQPALISSYDGTPTNFGIGIRDHLAKLAASTAVTTTTKPSVTTTVPPSTAGEPLATLSGATYYLDGTSTRTGPSGARVGVFGTRAEQSYEYQLVSGRVSGTGRPCTVEVMPISTTARFANAQGLIAQTAGTLDRPPGLWEICFLAAGRVVTGAVTYTVTG